MSNTSLQKYLHNHWRTIATIRASEHHTILHAKRLYEKETRIILLLSKRNYDAALWTKLKSIHDPNILPIEEIHRYPQGTAIIFPVLTPLKDYVRKEGLTLSQIIQLCKQISHALQSLHSQHILHLDVSPDNIFVDSNDHFVLGDFSNSISCPAPIHTLFHSKKAMTPPTFCPPNWNNELPNESTDQYGFAATLYTLLQNGTVPKRGYINFSADLLFTENDSFYCTDEPYDQAIQALKKCFAHVLTPSIVNTDNDQSILSFSDTVVTQLSILNEVCSYRLQIADATHPFYSIRTQRLQTSNVSNSSCNKLLSYATLHPFRFLLGKLPIRNNLSVPILQRYRWCFPIICLGMILLCATLFLSLSGKRSTSKQSAFFGQNSAASVSSGQSTQYLSDHRTSAPANTEEQSSVPKSGHKINMLESQEKSEYSDFFYHSDSENFLDVSNQKSTSLEAVLESSDLSHNWNILYAENNQFTSLSALQNHPQITELYLSNNKLCDLSVLSSLQHLKVLVLSDNLCNDVTPISKLTSLQYLDLSGNRDLSHIETLADLCSLQVLLLSDTNITKSQIEELKAQLSDCIIM